MFTPSLNEVVAKIKQSNCQIVVIDGRGGSGKTTFALQLASVLKGRLFSLDAYQNQSGDMFSAYNVEKKFEIQFEKRSFDEDVLLSEISKLPGQFVVLEGCFALKNLRKINNYFAIWLECSASAAADRLNKREITERVEISPDVIRLSTRKWQEAEARYISGFAPQNKADLLVHSV